MLSISSTDVFGFQAINGLFHKLFSVWNTIDDIQLIISSPPFFCNLLFLTKKKKKNWWHSDFLFNLTVQIDSVMSSRHAGEHEASRRLKSEFLVQFDGVMSNSTDLVIVIGKLWSSLATSVLLLCKFFGVHGRKGIT